MFLFLAAPLSETDRDAINAKYLIKIFSDDWGFYYTAMNNLKKIKVAMENVAVLTDQDRNTIATKITKLIDQIESAPKSGKWKSRAKIGTNKIWYKEVSDWE